MEMMRNALAAIYTNFETAVVSNSNRNQGGTRRTGHSGEKLVLKLSHVKEVWGS